MVVLVTGANKGIGFQIARKFLINDFPGTVLVTSRDIKRGKEALKTLRSEFVDSKIEFLQLDICDKNSREKLYRSVKSLCDGVGERLDIVINNAGIAYKGDSTAPQSEQAVVTTATNYTATKDFTELILPLVKGRVVFISSLCSDTSFKACSENTQESIKCTDLTSSKLDDIVDDFLDRVAHSFHLSHYSDHMYGMTKLFIRKYAEILGMQQPALKVYSCCPGWCKTDMAGWGKPPLTAEQGADNPWWLATTTDAKVIADSGGYYRNTRERVQWGYVWKS